MPQSGLAIKVIRNAWQVPANQTAVPRELTVIQYILTSWEGTDVFTRIPGISMLTKYVKENNKKKIYDKLFVRIMECYQVFET